jgi:hypothetical protein
MRGLSKRSELTRKMITFDAGLSCHKWDSTKLSQSLDECRSISACSGPSDLTSLAAAFVTTLNTASIHDFVISLGLSGCAILRQTCRSSQISLRRSRQFKFLLKDVEKMKLISSSFLHVFGIVRDDSFNLEFNRPLKRSRARDLSPLDDADFSFNDESDFGGPVFASLDDTPFTDFAAAALPLIKVVAQTGSTSMKLALPNYHGNGGLSDGQFVRLEVATHFGELEVLCHCNWSTVAATAAASASASASSRPADSIGMCFHKRLVMQIGVDRFRNETLPVGVSYSIPLATYSNRALIYCQPCRPERTVVGSLCTVTAGHVHCSECHGGKPQDTTSEALCEHVSYILSEVADMESLEICFVKCFELINAEVDDNAGSSSRLSFKDGRWTCRSLSHELEADEQDRFGVVPIPVPKTREEFLTRNPHRATFMGGPSDPETQSGAQFNSDLKLFAPLPTEVVSNAEIGCVYFDHEVRK